MNRLKSECFCSILQLLRHQVLLCKIVGTVCSCESFSKYKRLIELISDVVIVLPHFYLRVYLRYVL